jgi:hypothetical protein
MFTKTCRKDFEFLYWAVASVAKRCRDEVHWTFVCDAGETIDLKREIENALQAAGSNRIDFRIIETPDFWKDAESLNDGYLAQQWVKMNAHRVMPQDQGGYFLNWDSDVIAVKTFTEANFRNSNGLPIMYMTQFNVLKSGDDGQVHQMRQDFIRKTCGGEAPFEYMRTMPIWMNSNILRIGQERQEEWRRTLDSIRTGGMSEFNVIGWMSHQFFPDCYEWRNTQNGFQTWSGTGNTGENITHQGWSWGGMKEEIKILALQ